MKLLLSHKLLSSEDSIHHWERKAHAKSRFSEVAELVDSSSRFTIQARIHAEMLSPETSYAAYLVFELTENYKNLGFAISTVRFSGQDLISEQQTRMVHFQSSNSRGDGWTEVEMGSFYVHNGRNTEIEVTLVEPSGNMNMKSGLIVEGVEFRPSSGGGIFSKVRIS
ncbi:hypothetical protein CDL12_29924 [Handroanthus impetiginosus]|uniref:Uncharacterized protein n=1 Tax=Handroanthus impetiginosus TaxID=429701 RepID=A0A2G9FXI1_9LAMI|nr:hypothetical protein CDL12_29924 [Handroanthus impetiginosus]